MSLADHLSKGRVPQSWLGEDKTLESLKVSNFIRIVNERTTLYLVCFNIEIKVEGIDVYHMELSSLSKILFLQLECHNP